MNINDEKLKNLKALGFTGSIDDAYKAFLKSITAATGTIQDLEKIVFNRAGFSGTLNDMWMQHCYTQGITTGAYNDRLLTAWATLSGAGLASAAYDNLLLEDGFGMLQEDGYVIIL